MQDLIVRCSVCGRLALYAAENEVKGLSYLMEAGWDLRSGDAGSKSAFPILQCPVCRKIQSL